MRIIRWALIASIFVTFLIGCSKGIEKKEMQPKPPSPEVSRTDYNYGILVTVKHDGHLFIVEGRWEKGAIIHHPDCPCKISQ